MTALGGLDGLGPVAATTLPGPRRPAVDPSLVDALSGPDGTADPAPWPADTGGLTAVGDVFPDALTVDIAPWSASPAAVDVASTASTAAGGRSGSPVVADSVRRAAEQNRPAPASRPTAASRTTPTARPGQNTWTAASSGRPGQNVPRQAPPAARRTPAPARATSTAPAPPARPAYGAGSTGWSPGGTPSARDLLRMAREAGGVGLAATPFLRTGDQRSSTTRQPARPASRPTPPPARSTGQRSQWGSQQSQWGSQRTDPNGGRRPRRPRRSNGSALFTVLVLAVLILFASGGAQAILHLLTTLLGR